MCLTHTHFSYTYIYIEWIQAPIPSNSNSNNDGDYGDDSVEHFKRTRDLVYHESEISSAQLNRIFVPLLFWLLYSFNFFVSLYWPILFVVSAHNAPILSHTDSTHTVFFYIYTYRFIFCASVYVFLCRHYCCCCCRTFHLSYKKRKKFNANTV